MTHDELIEQAYQSAANAEDAYKRQLGGAQMLKHLKEQGYVIYKPEQPEQSEEES